MNLCRCALVGFLVALFLLTGKPVGAEDFPDGIRGFFSPGIKIGLAAKGDSFNVVFFTPEEFEFARDSQLMSHDELARKHATIIERHSKEADHTIEMRDDPLSPEMLKGISGDRRVAVYVDRALQLGAVRHVGNDFFLVDFGDDERPMRQAFSFCRLSSVRWFGGFNVAGLGGGQQEPVK